MFYSTFFLALNAGYLFGFGQWVAVADPGGGGGAGACPLPTSSAKTIL